MAEVNVPDLFDSLGKKIVGLQHAISTQGVLLDVKPYAGNQKEFKKWVQGIEKHARLNGLTEDRIKLVAFQTSQDAVSDYLDRLLGTNPEYSWAKNQKRVSHALRRSIGQNTRVFLITKG